MRAAGAVGYQMTETISVADVSAGPGGTAGEPGEEVALPVVEILTGRGFITGKSGSGKSNTASVVIERLLSKNFPVLIVDTDGEYYGLKEEFEILHAGADDECDIQVSPEHAEKIASLALEQNVPIILDVSGYLDEDDAHQLLLEVSRQLFAKEKKLKKPFLMLVEEVHEYIPEGGGMNEAGKMLIKIGKRGRKHGLGIAGISQRPADVKKDFITQCDWLVWHRLTWGNDTKVVRRILGSEYADAIEDMDNGEGFLMTDWSESIRRVQFHRKQTFDAGATPGLDDFERPELKSVSDNLVSELTDISDEQERRESELAELRQELDKKRQRIEELERELEEARDLRRMADQFSQALLDRSNASYRGGDGLSDAQRERRRDGRQRDLDEYERERDPDRDPGAEATTATESHSSTPAAESAGGDAGAPAGAGAAAAEATTGDEANEGSESVLDAIDDDVASDIGDDQRPVVARLAAVVADLDPVSRRMLAHYRVAGPTDPVAAHVAVGGAGDRELAYSHNRALREAALVEHAGRGTYRYALPDLVREKHADRLDEEEVEQVVTTVEHAFIGGDDAADDGT
jgi:TolA-binding protein